MLGPTVSLLPELSPTEEAVASAREAARWLPTAGRA